MYFLVFSELKNLRFFFIQILVLRRGPFEPVQIDSQAVQVPKNQHQQLSIIHHRMRFFLVEKRVDQNKENQNQKTFPVHLYPSHH